MHRIAVFLLMIFFCTALSAQKNGGRQPTKGKAAKKTAVSNTKTAARQPSLQTTKKQLQQQKKEVAAQQQAAKKRQQELEKQVKKKMQDVEALGSEIDDKASAISSIKTKISGVSSNIAELDSQLVVLRAELEERRQHYIKSVRYMYRNRNMKNRVMYVLSAKGLNQMYRRARFVSEYTAYQRSQAEAVKRQSELVEAKLLELGHALGSLDSLLAQDKEQQRQLQEKQLQQRQMVASLQKEQTTVKKLITQQQKQEAELDRQIDRIVAQELENARKAEEQRQRKLAEQRRREQERAAAAAAKARAEKAKASRQQGSKTTSRQNAKTTKQALPTTEKRQTTPPATPRTTAATVPFMQSDADKKLSGGFASNKGRLPMPITGSFRLIRKFGTYNMGGATLVSNGIQLEGKAGAKARCVFDGEVSSVLNPGGGYVVMVRHGRYITVYGNLSSVSVSKGQKVRTNQTLGTVGSGCILVFRLQNWRDPIDPRPWLAGI